MGVTMYWFILAAVIALGLAMPQQGKKRIYYIVTMAVIHAFVSGLRYMYLTGDLRKYAWNYSTYPQLDYFSDELLNDGFNTGFIWFSKFIAELSNGDFQIMLLVVAIIIEIAVALLIYKYSPRPCISYLVWNCMSFYLFGFSALKQSLAMALVMFAMVDILENRPWRFLITTIIAGLVHFPAYAFLPAYWIAKSRLKLATLLWFTAAAVLIYVFQSPIVKFITSLYYEEGTLLLADEAALGGRFYMIVVILAMGICLKGFSDRRFEKTFTIMAVAAIFQMFAGFDNIFTRFADYYFQMSILFLPMMVSSNATNPYLGGSHQKAVFRFNKRSLQLITLCMAVFLIWYYNRTNLSQTIASEVDNYLNYRFMWDVK